MTKNRLPSEHQEQALFTQWIDWQHPNILYFAVPNGGLRNKKTAATLKAEGVKPGVSDLVFLEPRGDYKGLLIEMKRQKEWSLSKDQKKFSSSAAKRGYKYVVCPGYESAKKAFNEYFNYDYI